jgi:hypothetical protein
LTAILEYENDFQVHNGLGRSKIKEKTTMIRRQCEKETLAEGPVCSVEICACGSVHVTLCALTLRLKPEALEAIAGTLSAAVLHLSVRELGGAEALRVQKVAPARGPGNMS